MSLQLIEIMRQIERSRKVDRQVVIQAIEAALISASRKNHGTAQDIRVAFNSDTGELLAFLKKLVVEEVHEPWNEIALEEARRIKPDAQLGEMVEMGMMPSEFGRIAAQTAKQVMLQRVRESERNAIFEEFKQRQGELLNGVVLREENRNLIVDLGDTEALLPGREQVPREFYKAGDRIKVFILDVRRTSRSPQVVVSRSHPGLIRKLFEMEVPEVADGVVEIRAVSREAGARSKVAVVSKDKNVDPVGACVGIKGSRIQSIIRELHGEKIDVIPFAENVETLLTSALQPAKIAQVVLAAENKQATVIVQDDQLALAIGKNGQNVRLASKLLGWKVDIVPHSKNQEEMRRRAEEAFLKTAPALDKIPGITANLAKKLQEAGYDSVAKFLGKTADQLTEIQGIGPKTAEKIMESLNPYLPHPAESRPAERTAAELFANLGGHEAAAPKPKEMAAGDLFANFDQAAAATEPRTEAPAEVQTEAPAETRERAPRKSRSDAPAGEGGEAV